MNRASRSNRVSPKFPSAVIVGTGHYVPDKVLTNADMEKLVDTSNEWIMERTGIRERRIAAPDQAASDLAFAAAEKALADATLTRLTST